MPCENCDFSGATLRCSLHPLVFGEVKEMHQATLTGQTWGDIVCDLEDELRQLETADEKAERELKVQEQKKIREEGGEVGMLDLRGLLAEERLNLAGGDIFKRQLRELAFLQDVGRDEHERISRHAELAHERLVHLARHAPHGLLFPQ
jgi:hypothetical protein